MSIQAFLDQLAKTPDTIEFDQIMTLIDEHYHYSPTGFSNGPDIQNAAGTNEGSCKIFAFAKLQQLTPEKTLACFGKYYREDVLQHPNDDNHGNIRAFMQHGWDGIKFEGLSLKDKH